MTSFYTHLSPSESYGTLKKRKHFIRKEKYVAKGIESTFLQNMPFGDIDYFQLKASEKQQMEERHSDPPF